MYSQRTKPLSKEKNAMPMIKTSFSIAALLLMLSACGSAPTIVNNNASVPVAKTAPTSAPATATRTPAASVTSVASSTGAAKQEAYAPTGHYSKAPSAVVHGDLFEAAKAGDTATIQGLLDQGANVNSTNKQGETPLHAAASADQSQVAMLLIQKGANVNSTTTGGWTPLHTAARFGATKVLTLLIAKGANVSAVNADGRTPEAEQSRGKTDGHRPHRPDAARSRGDGY